MPCAGGSSLRYPQIIQSPWTASGFAADIPHPVYIEPYVKSAQVRARVCTTVPVFIARGLDRWAIGGHYDLRLGITMKAQV